MDKKMMKDHIAVVTGASSGIGRALAEMLTAEGAKVFAVGRSEERLAAVKASGNAVATLAVDIEDPDAASRIIDEAVAELGAVDIVCANAGTYVAGDIWTTTSAEIRSLITTNVIAAMDLVRAATIHMRERGSGDILVTSSVSGHQAIEWEPVYSGSKHAMQSFVHGVRRQLVGSGVRISSLAPGIVLNELWQRAAPDLADPGKMESLAEAGKGLRVSDVADAALFILTRPANATVRDLVLLPTNQDI
jgi:ribitol 2-dehydrogenase